METNQQQDNETISLKQIIIYYLCHWKAFLVAGCISLILALLYLILVPRTYEIMAKVQLLEDKGTSGAGLNIGDAVGLMQSFGLGGISGSGLILDNEMAKFMSTTTLKNTVLQLDLNTAYYKPYSFHKMYENIPLLLSPDSLTQEKLDTPITFKVNIKENGKVKIKAKTEQEKYTFEFNTLPAEIKMNEGNFVLSYREEVVKPLSLKIEFSPAIAVAEDLSENILFDNFSKTADIIEMTYSDHEKKRGTDLLQTLIEIYNHQEDSVKQIEHQKSIQFLDEQLKNVVSDLSEIEIKIEKYKLQNKMTDIEADVLFYVEQAKEIEVKIIELEAQVHLVDLLNNYIKDPQNKYNLVPAAMLVSSSGENTSNPIMAYNEALLERSKILQSTKGNNPLIEQINKQVDQLRESVFLSIENIKKSLNLTINDLKGKEKLIFDKMGTVPTLERNYVDLKRQQEINQALYLILLQKKEDYILAAGDSKDKARIIEQPYVKQKAVAPRKLYALIGMFIFTLIIPAIYLFCKEQLSSLLNEYKNVKSNELKL